MIFLFIKGGDNSSSNTLCKLSLPINLVYPLNCLVTFPKGFQIYLFFLLLQNYFSLAFSQSLSKQSLLQFHPLLFVVIGYKFCFLPGYSCYCVCWNPKQTVVRSGWNSTEYCHYAWQYRCFEGTSFGGNWLYLPRYCEWYPYYALHGQMGSNFNTLLRLSHKKGMIIGNSFAFLR